MKLVDDCIYEVYGKHETRTEGEIQLAGSNASAEGEDADGGADPNSTSGVDIVLNHRLTESGFGSKKDYTVYLKDYMKEVLGRFKDLQFFVGESMDNDAMILIMDYKDYQGEERPFLIAFKHGLEEEKV